MAPTSVLEDTLDKEKSGILVILLDFYQRNSLWHSRIIRLMNMKPLLYWKHFPNGKTNY
ncbi:hypothetical protein M422DRAFT_30312 [Sphaerobolus stellatus SS14]|uniref:Uncharacterized protein n=1 Tax=Sphaerobolus stellatus (strain SS14) TaxID=990650 RepID=A0A0C9VZW0_SPHS4|nr:hypothetical protein M422DRAFT_30312 [Sphaerobolus stellatus SS14]